MIHRYTYKQLVWIDLENPTSEEVREIMQEYDLHPTVAQEILLPTANPRVEIYSNFIFIILHFPAIKHTHSGDSNQEVDFIIGKNFLITIRYDSIDSVAKFSKIFEVNSILDRSNMGDHTGFIFYYMIKEMYGSLAHELDYLKDSLENIEDQIFVGNERAMVIELSKVSRDLLKFHHATNAHKQVLRSFEPAAMQFFREGFSFYIKDMIH